MAENQESNGTLVDREGQQRRDFAFLTFHSNPSARVVYVI